MPAFDVQHYSAIDVGNSGDTQAITSVGALSAAIGLINSNRYSTGGRADLNAGNLETDDISGAIRLTAVDTLTLDRESAGNASDMRFSASVWEYTGSAGGPNEFIVRGRYSISLNGSTNTATQAVSGISSIAKCVPFITGVRCNATGDDWDSATVLAFMSGTDTLNVHKGSLTNNTTVEVTVVEFTGSNWTVLHGDSGLTGADTGSITLRDAADGTGTATDVPSGWSGALIVHGFHQDNTASNVDDSIADTSAVYEPGSDDQTVDWIHHSNHVSAQSTNRHFVHVIDNSEWSVTRYSNTSNSAGEVTIDITSAGLTGTDEALVFGSSTSSGNGTAYGRGWRNYYLNSATQAAHWCHRSGNTCNHRLQIVDLNGMTESAGGSVSGSGAAAADDATAAGAAEREIAGSGTPASDPAQLSGDAERAITGSGTPASGASATAADAARHVSGSGAPGAASSTTAGTAARGPSATGVLAAQDAAVSGTGERDLTGTGNLVAAIADVSGAGEREITGEGEPLAGATQTTAVAERSVDAEGSLDASAAATTGAGAVGSGDVVGSGVLVAGSAATQGIASTEGDPEPTADRQMRGRPLGEGRRRRRRPDVIPNLRQALEEDEVLISFVEHLVRNTR